MDKSARLEQFLDGIRSELLAVVESVPPEKWRQQPPQGGWSCGEVIAHLTQTETAIQNGMKRVFSAEPRSIPFLKRWHIPPFVQQWRIARARTPIPLDPELIAEKDEMLSAFRALREETLKILGDNRARDLRRWRFPHPFFGMLDGYTWFKSIGYHEVRHTKQLRGIVKLLS